jgi:hypothetical protein
LCLGSVAVAAVAVGWKQRRWGGDIRNVIMERLFEGNCLKMLDDGAGERRIRWAVAGVKGGVWDRRLWQLWRWGGSGAEGRDGQ